MVGRLHVVLAPNTIKNVSGRKFRAMLDFKLAEVSETHGIGREVIDLLATHGLYMEWSMRCKHKQHFARVRVDKYVLSLATSADAIPWDNCAYDHPQLLLGVGRTCVLQRTRRGFENFA